MKQIPINLGGNKCGHDKMAPALRLARPVNVGKGGIPLVLVRTMERMIAYYDRPSMFPSLNTANGSDRQQRSERREACLIVLATLLKYCDLTTMRIGIRNPEGFRPFSLAFIYRKAGCTISFSRFERAWYDLKAAGLVSSKQKVTKLVDNTPHYETSVKVLNPLLFAALGLGQMLKYARKYASRSFKKIVDERNAIANKSGQARAAIYLGSLAAKVNKERKDAKEEKQKAIRYEKQNKKASYDLKRKVAELAVSRPDLNRDQLYALAEQMIGN